MGAESRAGRVAVREWFWRDASGRLTFDLARVAADDYPAVCRDVRDAFALAPSGSPVIGPDQMFVDFRRGAQVVGFDWDCWMGFMVVAETGGAEALVRDIGAWLLSSSRWASASDHAEPGCAPDPAA